MRYAEVSDHLVKAALYRVEAIEDAPVQVYSANSSRCFLPSPEIINRECPTCGMTRWAGGAYMGRMDERTFSGLTYKCRNCGEMTFNVWVFWWRENHKVMMVKVGQYPKLEVSIPKEFDRALGDRRSLYIKGMTSRHNGYGIGALTYFRRLIEDTTDEMLNLLEEAMKTVGGDPAAIDRLVRAKASRAFEDKVKLAAEVLPTHLRPGGINPFGNLYDLLSIGLHNLSDEECCDIVDAMDQSLKFIYAELKSHAEDARTYQGAVKSVNEKLARLKLRKEDANSRSE